LFRKRYKGRLMTFLKLVHKCLY